MYGIARKSNLSMNLNKLKKYYPNDYNFYPQTWYLSADYRDLEKYFNANGGCYIVKPSASSQGKGIFIVQDIKKLLDLEDHIVQIYIQNPLLIDHLKFDMRVYVLVTGCDPLRIFIHKEGLARFATETYKKPIDSNLEDMCMHLTNYSLNKFNPKFIRNTKAEDDSVGHKRSLRSVFVHLQAHGCDIKALWAKIADIVIKTLCSIQPTLAHTYRSCRPNDPSDAMCFELLGFDILLDSNYTPYLLEVNHSPSFEISSPLDKKIKSIVIKDTLMLLNLTEFDKNNFEAQNKAKIFERTVLRKSFDEKTRARSAQKEVFEAERNYFENSNTGGFVKIFPSNERYYKKLMMAAKGIWEQFTGAKKFSVKPRSDSSTKKPTTPKLTGPEEPKKYVFRKFSRNHKFYQDKSNSICNITN